MTDEEELSDAQREELLADLRGLEADLTAALASSAEGAKPVDLDEPIGRLSRMDAMQQQKMVQANRRSQEARLRAVHLALSAAKAGEYGECRSCGGAIRYGRLKARPEVMICIQCQSARER